MNNTKSGVLIFCEKSVFFSFQSPKPANFPAYSRNMQDKLGPRRFLKTVDKPRIDVFEDIPWFYQEKLYQSSWDQLKMFQGKEQFHVLHLPSLMIVDFFWRISYAVMNF